MGREIATADARGGPAGWLVGADGPQVVAAGWTPLGPMGGDRGFGEDSMIVLAGMRLLIWMKTIPARRGPDDGGFVDVG